jgi:hypothetical protein
MVSVNDMGETELEEHTLVDLLRSLSASDLDSLGNVVCSTPRVQLELNCQSHETQ